MVSGYEDGYDSMLQGYSEPMQMPLLEQIDKARWVVDKKEKEPEYEACPYLGGTIYLTPLAFAKVTALMDRFKKEWLAYLIGSWQGSDIVVEDLFIPEQVSSAASVSEVEDAPPEGSIGVMHSHVRMGAFFSGTDDEFLNSNHTVSIVVSRLQGKDDLVFKSNIRRKVACGITMLINMPVKIALVPPEVRVWVEECSIKVKDWVYKGKTATTEVDYPPKIEVNTKSNNREDDGLFNSQLDTLLENVDKLRTPTVQLSRSYVKAFPSGVRAGDSVQKVDDKTLLEALSYMERYGLDRNKGNTNYATMYLTAWKEMVDRLSRQ